MILSARFFAICLVLAASGGVTVACSQGSENPAAVNAKLKSEIDARLPRGSSVRDVERWLASKGLKHSGLIDNARLAHLGKDPYIYEIKSLIAGAKRIAPVLSDTQITFVFDRSRKLIASRVEPVHTGL